MSIFFPFLLLSIATKAQRHKVFLLVTFGIQCCHQIDVAIGEIEFITEQPEFFNGFFTELGLQLRVSLAEENPAACETIISCTAFIIFKIRASLPR
jgi:hypothetical protein